MAPRVDAPQVASQRKEQDDSFFPAALQEKLEKQTTEYLPIKVQKSESPKKGKDVPRNAQGQIIKGLTHQRKEEIVVHDIAVVNKNLHSPGLFGLSSSLYLNESHGTYRQAMSSKNKDINHLSEESFGRDEGRGAQLSDVSMTNVQSHNRMMSQTRKKEQQRHMTAAQMEKLDQSRLRQKMKQHKIADSPKKSSGLQTGLATELNSASPPERTKPNLNEEEAKKLPTNRKLRKINADSVQ